MLGFAIFAAAFLVALIAAIIWLYPPVKKISTVLGLNPSSKEDGNLTDIGEAGSLHEFLVDLHERFGPIASFWWGQQYTVSIASAELFKQHQHKFDRPPLLFEMVKLLSTEHSIQFANGEDGKNRRHEFDKVFSHDSLTIYYSKFYPIADEIVAKWKRAGQSAEHLPVGEHMFLFALKAALVALLGNKFSSDEETLSFKNSYDVAWQDMEQRLVDPEPPAEDSLRGQNFKRAVSQLRKIVGHALKEREDHPQKSKEFLLVDAIISHHDDSEKRFADVITYTVGGFHTTGNLLTWCIYFLATHDEVQDQVYEEIIDVLGKSEPVTHHNIAKLKYIRQVLDETLRCAIVAPWAARFEQDEDTELDGHKIPKGTPVIHALGVSFLDENFWPEPYEFDPDRFAEENAKIRPSLAFSPYGFAGKRQCPGYRFAYLEATIMIVAAVRNFRIEMVPDQVVLPKYGLVTHPQEEIWIEVFPRK